MKRKVAVIGAGNITSTRHIPTLLKTKQVEIAGVIDRNPEKARSLAERFSIPNFATSLDAPWMKEVTAVTVGVPPQVHYEVAARALNLGKHVLLEKPMAMSVSEGLALVKLAQELGLILCVVQNFQFATSALELKRLVDSGRLGKVTGIHCFQTSTRDRRLPVWHEDLPLGLFYDESPHLLYLLKAFGGDVSVTDASVIPSRTGRSTPAVISAHFDAGGVPATLYNNFEAPISEWHFIVYGTREAAVIDLFRDILVRIPHDGQHYARDILRSSCWMVATHVAGFFKSGLRLLSGDLLYGNQEVFAKFFSALESGIAPAGISAQDGVDVLKLQQRIVELTEAKQDPIRQTSR